MGEKEPCSGGSQFEGADQALQDRSPIQWGRQRQVQELPATVWLELDGDSNIRRKKRKADSRGSDEGAGKLHNRGATGAGF